MADCVEIRKSGVVVTIPRDQFGTIVESPEGLIFQLRNNMFITYEEPYLNQIVKRTIKVTADSFQKGTLVIDLDNPRNPTRVTI